MFRITKWPARAADFQLTLSAIGIFGILLAIFCDVFLRAVFNAPISGTLEIVSFWCMIPVTFFPLMYLEYHRQHIETDLFYQMFPLQQRHLADVVSNCIAVIIYAGLAWLTFDQAVTATQAREVSMGVNLISIWPVRWVLPIAFGFASLAAAIKTFRIFRKEDQNG